MSNDVYWRDSGRFPRLYVVDARVTYVFILVLFHLRLSTICLALLSMVVFWIVEMFGLTPPVALRTLYLYITTLNYRWSYIGNHSYINRRTL